MKPKQKRDSITRPDWEQQRRQAEAVENYLAGRPQKRYGYVSPHPWKSA